MPKTKFMNASVFHGTHDVRLGKILKPDLDGNEVLIRVKAAGICGTDMHIYEGKWKVKTPLILGHEFSGIVSEVGDKVEGLEIGDRVVAEPNITCGRCHYCLMSEPNFFCINLKTTGHTEHGAFAEYTKTVSRNIYSIPDCLSFKEASMIEPVACCVRGIDQAQIKIGDVVAVIGAGPIGLILMQLARNAGASKIIQTDLVEERLKMARTLGADHTLNIKDENPISEANRLTGGYGVDVAIEAVGKPESITQAIQMARRGGRVTIFGVSPQNATCKVKPFELYDKELNITTSYRSPFTFQRAIDISSSNRIKLKPLITHVLPLNRIRDILDGKLESAMKVIIKP